MSASQIIPLKTVIGRLAVVGPEEGLDSDVFTYMCECSCGAPARPYRKKDLKSGRILSCGCLHREICSARMTAINTSHGMHNTKEYKAWARIIERTCNPRSDKYAEYGGAGITVAEEFRSFFPWYQHMGPCPANCNSVDRKDGTRGYQRGNMRWADDFMQANNRKSNKRVSFNGQDMTYAEWDRHLGFARGTVRQRLHMGWSLEQAITTPRGQVGNRFYRINPIEC